MKQNFLTWLTLLLFAGAVFGQEPAQPPQPPTPPPVQDPVAPPQDPVAPPAPPPPIIADQQQVAVQVDPPFPEIIVREPDYFEWDKMIIRNEYQRNHFTYPYLSAVLRRALSIMGFKYAAVLVQPITVGHDGWVESVVKNSFRSLPGAYYAWGANSEDKLDGHFASVARIIFPQGYVINCVSTFTRRKVDPLFTWVRLTPCAPDFGTAEAWKKAAELDLEGFLDIEKETFERTPHVNIGPESFKSRRTKR